MKMRSCIVFAIMLKSATNTNAAIAISFKIAFELRAIFPSTERNHMNIKNKKTVDRYVGSLPLLK